MLAEQEGTACDEPASDRLDIRFSSPLTTETLLGQAAGGLADVALRLGGTRGCVQKTLHVGKTLGLLAADQNIGRGWCQLCWARSG